MWGYYLISIFQIVNSTRYMTIWCTNVVFEFCEPGKVVDGFATILKLKSFISQFCTIHVLPISKRS